jgi:Flp pilus assembly CpaE family ATPase
VRGLAARLGLLDRLGFDSTRRRIVLNRHRSRSRVKPRAIVEAVGVCANYLVANDFPTVHRSLDEGRTLLEVARRARVTRDIEKMTHDLFGELASESPARRKR